MEQKLNTDLNKYHLEVKIEYQLNHRYDGETNYM